MAWLCGCAGPAADPTPVAGPDPAAVARFDAAVAAADEGETRKAQIMLSGLAGSHPEFVAPQLNLAILYMQEGRDDEAEDQLLALLEVSPDTPEAWNQLGLLRRRSGRFAEADDAYRAALDADVDYGPAHRNRGVLLDLYLGQPDLALGHYRRYVELSGGDADVERWIAELELRVEREQREKVAER